MSQETLLTLTGTINYEIRYTDSVAVKVSPTRNDRLVAMLIQKDTLTYLIEQQDIHRLALAKEKDSARKKEIRKSYGGAALTSSYIQSLQTVNQLIKELSTAIFIEEQQKKQSIEPNPSI